MTGRKFWHCTKGAHLVIPTSTLRETRDDALVPVGDRLKSIHLCGLVLAWSGRPLVLKRRFLAEHVVIFNINRFGTSFLSLTSPGPVSRCLGVRPFLTLGSPSSFHSL